MDSPADTYPARLRVDYPEKLDRVTTLLRVIWIIPILIILSIVTGEGGEAARDGAEWVSTAGPGIAVSLAFATALMIVFRQRYPRWWFDFQLELARFTYRVGSYLFLLRDEYPSTEDEQAVHLELDYPDARTQLNRWLPLIKWLLALPHYLVLIVLAVIGIVVVLVAWVAILITGRYPRGLFDYIVGFGRWGLRVQAYAFFMVTDRYPPFSLN